MTDDLMFWKSISHTLKTTTNQRYCVSCNKQFDESEAGQTTGLCSNCREKEGMVTHHWWSDIGQEGHHGSVKSPKRAYLAIGVAGAGKSTLLKPMAEKMDAGYVSTDRIREELTGDEGGYGIAEDQVFKTAYDRMHQYLDDKGSVVVDATNTHPQYRKEVIDHLRKKADEVHAIYFDVPLDIALKRNAERERRVPDEVIGRMYKQLQDDPPNGKEGLDSITRIGIQ